MALTIIFRGFAGPGQRMNHWHWIRRAGAVRSFRVFEDLSMKGTAAATNSFGGQANVAHSQTLKTEADETAC